MTIEKTLSIGVNEDLEFSARWVREDGTPYIPTAAFCQVRKKEGNAEDNLPVIDASLGQYITIDPIEGWANVHVPHNVISEIPPGWYKFDLLLRRDDGRVLRPMKGTIEFEPGVTFIT